MTHFLQIDHFLREITAWTWRTNQWMRVHISQRPGKRRRTGWRARRRTGRRRRSRRRRRTGRASSGARRWRRRRPQGRRRPASLSTRRRSSCRRRWRLPLFSPWGSERGRGGGGRSEESRAATADGFAVCALGGKGTMGLIWERGGKTLVVDEFTVLSSND